MTNNLLPSDLLSELAAIEQANPANEAEVETKVLLHVFRLLGYSDIDRADKPSVLMHFGRERTTKYPDFLLYDGGERSLSNALVAVEAKDATHTISDAVAQAKSYALWAGTPFFLVCNGVLLRAVQFIPGTDDHRVIEIKIGWLREGWHVFSGFLSRAQAILTKERLAYTALYLPEIEKLPPQEFFREYLNRVRQRFSRDDQLKPQALDAAQAQLHSPRIPVHAHFETAGTHDFDETGIIENVLIRGARVLISGSAGAGKTTLLHRIAYRASEAALTEQRNVLPIFVRLVRGIPESPEGAFEVACTDMGIRVLPNLYRFPLSQSHMLLLLDGADEADLSQENRARFARLIERADASAILVTTRPIGMDELEDTVSTVGFERGEIRDLTEEAVEMVFQNYLGEQGTAVLRSMPAQLRENLRSPLLALMTIRVAQLMGDLQSFSQFQLYQRYVEVLDHFFNASTIRGSTGVRPGNAMTDIALVAAAMNGVGVSTLSLDSLAHQLVMSGRKEAVASLVNMGLLTSTGGIAQFAHRSFADFGLAVYVLNSIRAADLNSFFAVKLTSGAHDFLHGQITSSDEEILVLDVLMRLARSKPNVRYIVPLLRFALRKEVSAVLKELDANYSQHRVTTRLAIAKYVGGHHESEAARALLDSLLRCESEPDILLLMLYSARNRLDQLDDELLSDALENLRRLRRPKQYQALLALRIVERVQAKGVPRAILDDLMITCARIGRSAQRHSQRVAT